MNSCNPVETLAASSGTGPGQAVSPSILGRYCAGFIEASWLIAVAVVPLLVNRLTQTTFEPDKIVVLRSLALLILAAWIVRLVDRGMSSLPEIRQWSLAVAKAPLAWPIALLAVAYMVATVFSVNPHDSFWGSFDRLQGTYTFLSCLIIFGAVATHLRRWDQVERLVTVTIVGSLPVALYAIIQRAGYDPVIYTNSGDPRVSSTAGQPVFLAAYLLMVLPLNCWRMHSIWTAFRHSTTNPIPAVIAFILYLLIAAAQLTAFFLAESRGPFVGLLASIAVGLVLFAAIHRRWRWIRAGIMLGGLGAGFLVLLNIPHGPLEPLRHLPILSRFAVMLSPRHGSTDRAEFWQEAPKLMLAREPLPYPGGGVDEYHHLRPFVGYGPETLDGVVSHQYSMPGPVPERLNRFHNLLWDLWTSVGAFGVLAGLGLVVVVFHQSYRRLGLLGTGGANGDTERAQDLFFWALVVGCAGVGGVAFSLWQGPGFIGLGLLLGLALAFATYPILSQWIFRPAGESSSNPASLLLIALLSALAGHVVETAFSFQVSSTALLFWLFLGVIVVLLQGDLTPAIAAVPERFGWRQHQPGLIAGLFTALIMLVLVSVFVQLHTGQALSPAQLLARAITRIPGGRTTPAIACLLLVAWVVPSFALTVPYGSGAAIPLSSRSPRGLSWFGQFYLALAISALAAGGYAFWKAQQLVMIGPFPNSSASGTEVMRQCAGYEAVYLTFILAIAAILLVGGVILSVESGHGSPRGRLPSLLLALIIFSTALVASYRLNVSVMCADVAFHWAESLHSQQVRPGSLYAYERAAALGPRNYQYGVGFARALREQAQAISDPAKFRDLLTQAEQVLLRVQKTSTLNRGAYLLGELYLIWGMRENEPQTKLSLARKAQHAFDQALAFEPHSEFVWRQSATADRLLSHNSAEADRKDQRASEIAGGQAQRLGTFGAFYLGLGGESANPELKHHYALRALDYYQQGLIRCYESKAKGELPPEASLFDWHFSKGSAYIQLQDIDHALACYQEAVKTADKNNGNLWKAEQLMGRLFYEKGEQTPALIHAVLAYDKAPTREKPRLLEFIQRVQNGPVQGRERTNQPSVTR